jgi:hypothetical protein
MDQPAKKKKVGQSVWQVGIVSFTPSFMT